MAAYANAHGHRATSSLPAAYARRPWPPPAAAFDVCGRLPTRTAAFFDLDKTVIAKSSTLAFSRPFYQGGLINRRAVLRSAYAQFVFPVGGADHDQMERMRAYLSSMATRLGRRAGQEIVARDPARARSTRSIYDEAADPDRGAPRWPGATS